MALTWENRDKKDRSGKVISESYRTQLPHWGEASVHPHIHYPGLFLTCDSLGIEMHPLGTLTLEDAVNSAEAELERALKQYIAWCGEGLAALHNGQEQ